MKIEFDKFNSDIFEMVMGNIVELSDLIKNEDVNNIICTAKEKGYQHLNIKVPTALKNTTNILLQNVFKLVDTQLRYQLSSKLIGGGYSPDNIKYRKFESKDRLQMDRIARDAYSLDQFHSDEKLPSHLCDKYYVEWMNNSCDGFADKVMVLSHTDTIAGYITINYKEENSAAVGLAAVGKQFQRRGYFTYLIEQTLRMLYEEGIEYLFYGTQLANKPVLRIMSKYSAIPVSSNHVLHRMI